MWFIKKIFCLFLSIIAPFWFVLGECSVDAQAQWIEPGQKPQELPHYIHTRQFSIGTGSAPYVIYAPACPLCTYFIINNGDPTGGSDSSIVFANNGNPRGEIGNVGTTGLSFKTISGLFPTESFSLRMYIMGASDANPGNIGMGTLAGGPASLLDIGTTANTQDCQFDYNADLTCINGNGTPVWTLSGAKTAGNGAGIRLRNTTDGSFLDIGSASWYNGGGSTAYHQIIYGATQSDGSHCFIGGALSACGFNIDAANHFQSESTSIPTISSNACGSTTQGTITAGGSDNSFKVTVGTALVTSCTISFGTAWTTAPTSCILQPANTTAAAQGTVLGYVSSISTSQLVISGSALASVAYYVHCF